MTGQVPDAGPYIERMDILVNASDREPFGIVLLEGMARGVAVVAVDSGGPAEFIEDGRTGVLARSGEPQALADALEPLLVSPALRAGARRRRAASVSLREFTDAAMRERFFAQLEALVGAAGETAGRRGSGSAGRARPERRERGCRGSRLAAPCAVTIVAHDIGPVGGMERQLAELALGLRRAGHEVR